MTDKDIIDLDQADGVFVRFVADSTYQDDPDYHAASLHFSVPLPEVIIPRRSTAALSAHAEDEQTDLDFHTIEFGARERIAGQKARNGDKTSLSINFTTTPN